MKSKFILVLVTITVFVLNSIVVKANGSEGLVYTYDFKALTAELSRSEKATGDVVIPSQVIYDDKTYTVVSIANAALYGLPAVTSVTIPPTVTAIGDRAFYECTNLATISVSPNTVRIGEQAFNYTAWYNAQPDGPVYVNSVLCSYKGKAKPNTSLVVKEGTISVSPLACAYDKNITDISLPTTIRWVSDAFYATGWYDNQPDGVLYINSVLYGYKGSMPVGTQIDVREGTTVIAADAFYTFIDQEITAVTFPNSLRFINERAFYASSKLTSVVIPDGVEEIEEAAFGQCGLEKVELGRGLKKLGTDIFVLSSKLKELYSYSLIPPTCQPLTFNGVYFNCTLYVPKGTVDAYKNSIGWNKFKKIQEFGDGTDVRTEREDAKVSVISLPGEIRIDAPDDALVYVHTITGQVIYQGRAHRIPLDKGVYVVTVENKCQKVIVY